MVILDNRQQNGNFEFRRNNLVGKGNYVADFEGNINSISANFSLVVLNNSESEETEIGTVNIQFYNEEPTINVNSKGFNNCDLISSNLEEMYLELKGIINKPEDESSESNE